MKANLLAAIASISASLALGTAHADPVVTFMVPLKLENLPPDIVKARVRCWVLKKDSFVLATNMTDVPVGGGKYAGPPVSVPIDLTSPTWAADAASWKCALKLVTANGADGTPDYNATTTMFKAKAGTPLVTETKGSF